MTGKGDDGALFGIPATPTGPGPVYQGVCLQVRALFGRAKDRPAGSDAAAAFSRVAGIVAMARSLAQSIDRVSGHNGGRQASGHQLSLMHGQLLAVLQALAPEEAGKPDAFATLLERMNATTPPTGPTPDDRATASPHSEE